MEWDVPVLPYTRASPRGGNIAALQGHFRGIGVLHLVLKFPRTYPTDPPSVRLCTYIPHSSAPAPRPRPSEAGARGTSSPVPTRSASTC